MQINFEKAHKLISKLEAQLQATTEHTNQARLVLDEWRQKGESGLRKKTAQALKLVRKKADSFAGALVELEQSFVKSLDRLTDSIDDRDSSAKPKPKSAKSKKKAVKRKPAPKAAVAAK